MRRAPLSGWSRRELLVGGGAALLAPRLAGAFGPASRVDVAEIQLASGTGTRPAAWRRLLYEVMQTTSIEANPESTLLDPEDPALFAHPFMPVPPTSRCWRPWAAWSRVRARPCSRASTARSWAARTARLRARSAPCAPASSRRGLCRRSRRITPFTEASS